MTTQLIRPGILVALKTQVSGGVHYSRADLPADENAQRWETTKRVDDPEELDRAGKARSEALKLIRRECVATSFGLLCTKDNELKLDSAVAKARQIVAAFNDGARHTSVRVSLLKGRVADNDVEAIGSILGEVADLIRQMEDGIANVDVKAIREAANRARGAASMLGDEQQKVAQTAIAAARKVARQIVKRTQEIGENSVAAVAGIDTTAISTARMQFLDLTREANEEADSAIGALNLQRFADLDGDDEAAARDAEIRSGAWPLRSDPDTADEDATAEAVAERGTSSDEVW